MKPHPCRSPILVVALTAIWLAGCATVPPPRTDDPWETFNRKAWAFNQGVDEVVVRPVAKGYRKVTNEPVRRSVSNFFTNLRMPVTVANDLLQGEAKRALQDSGRFLLNLTVGLAGIFDPASSVGMPLQPTDFGATLAHWGVPEGPYLVLPVFGPTTPRDVWQIPVDSYYLDPLGIYARKHDFRWHAQLAPGFLYLVQLRASALDAESFLQSAYDPYVFMRDAWRQRRLYVIYRGDPPAEVIDHMMGLDDFDPDELLEEQEEWERSQEGDGGGSA